MPNNEEIWGKDPKPSFLGCPVSYKEGMDCWGWVKMKNAKGEHIAISIDVESGTPFDTNHPAVKSAIDAALEYA